jgi:hypothetical protein
MTIVFMGNHSFPTYTALTTDVVANGLPSGTIVGGTIYLTDTSEWFILDTSLKMQEFVFPFQITIGSSVEIGSVFIDQQLTQSITLSPYFAIQSVSSPGTSVALMSSATYIQSVTIWPKSTNTTSIFIGTAAVDKDTSQQITITAGGAPITIDSPLGYKLNLNEWYIDATTAGEGCFLIYLK